ncbi:PDZ domain-containing protein MAGIX isoform X3 [Sciurus carolinensis]|uniref:PDZ domain-containing protein MAGIX isoform X3 n=1 Tax=Sciurus carolinensis TaxID=30640 RepID=UPI001FB422A3|nr:PDZ domain-containing protein MAGIX isoform X3 [Sciurus carolinensis]
MELAGLSHVQAWAGRQISVPLCSKLVAGQLRVHPADYWLWSRAQGALQTLGGAEEVVNSSPGGQAAMVVGRVSESRAVLQVSTPHNTVEGRHTRHRWNSVLGVSRGTCTQGSGDTIARGPLLTHPLHTHPSRKAVQKTQRESLEGRGLPLPAGPRARRLLGRLDARPLAARAAADLSALVRRAGATLRLRPKEAISVLDSADIEVTDSRLPHTNVVERRPQHRQTETLGMRTAPPRATQCKTRCASKSLQDSGRFSVELVRGPTGFGLTLSGGRDVGDAPLAVRGLLKDGPAHRCGHLQTGDLILHINGESTQGLSHAQAVDRIRAGGSRLHLVLQRPNETQPAPPFPDCCPDAGGRAMMMSHNAGISPVHHPQFRRTPNTRGSPEPSPETAAHGPAVPPSEHRAEDPDDCIPGSPGPWLVPSEERLSRALGLSGAAQLAQETAAGRRRH